MSTDTRNERERFGADPVPSEPGEVEAYTTEYDLKMLREYPGYVSSLYGKPSEHLKIEEFGGWVPLVRRDRTEGSEGVSEFERLLSIHEVEVAADGYLGFEKGERAAETRAKLLAHVRKLAGRKEETR